MTSITRPRLLPHAMPRQNMTDGARTIVLYDGERLESHRIGGRAWLVMSGMDGTRDADGLVAFCKADGATVSKAEVEDLVRDLAEAELVGEGVGGKTSLEVGLDEPIEGEPALAPAPPAERIWQLPGFTIFCDGSGTCCRFYPSVAFSMLDASRAIAAAPQVLDGGTNPAKVFLPLYGSDRRALGVTLVDGRCAYLETDGACAVHRATGSASKPLGCRTYPARFVDDGDAIRISPWPECACVLASGAAPDPRGEPLLAPTLSSRAELDPAFHLERVPASVSVNDSTSVAREELVAWSKEVFECRATDGVAALLALSSVLAKYGLDVERSKAALERPAPADVDEMLPALQAMAPRLEALAAETWRSPKDMVRVTAEALREACLLAQAMTADLLAGPGRYEAAESFYVRTVLFGHHLVHRSGTRTMSLFAYDRAARVLLARALGVVASMAGLEDPAFSQPLALVDATMRGYGTALYVRDLG